MKEDFDVRICDRLKLTCFWSTRPNKANFSAYYLS